MTNKEKFLKLVDGHDETVFKAIAERRANRAWLKKSQAIALKILQTLKAKGSNQKKLAEAVGVSAQQVNKWVKGNENFTLETLTKLEAALGVSLIEVNHESSIAFQAKRNLQLEAQSTLRKNRGQYPLRSKRLKKGKLIQMGKHHSEWKKDKDKAHG